MIKQCYNFDEISTIPDLFFPVIAQTILLDLNHSNINLMEWFFY
jgi:hypothetical protein